MDDRFTPNAEGGDKIILATLQNRTARVRRGQVTESFTLNLAQWTEAGLKLYHGANAIVGPNGEIGPHPSPVPTECAFLAVFDDGSQTFTVHVPYASIMRSDVANLGDDETFATLPIEIDCLKVNQVDAPYTVSPLVDTASIVTWVTPANAFATALEVGEPFLQQLVATGVGPFTVSAGTVPAGMAVTSTGLFYGSPDTAGAFNFTVQRGAATRQFTGSVQA